MTAATPPAHNTAPATQRWAVGTVQDLWSLSDARGVPACTIFRALDEYVGEDSESVGDFH